MSTIQNITISGLDSSDTLTPIVAGLNPVIKWEFTSDRTDVYQKSYEYRLGTSDDNWGFSNFDGDVASKSVTGTGNYFYYSFQNLARGITYYGQIRTVDNEGVVTPWSQFSFKLNQLPFIISAEIVPDSPTTITSLELNYLYFDPDDHAEKNTKVRWYKNNIHQPEFDNLCTVPATDMIVGDDWSAKVIPGDGMEFGPVTETFSVTVQATDFGISNVKILPEEANIDDILKIEFNVTDDEYFTLTETPVIVWYINNVAVQESTSVFLRADLDVGDLVYAIVKIISNNVSVSQAQSNSIIIGDVSWHLENLTVDGLTQIDSLANLTPILEWDIYKSKTTTRDIPAYFRVVITKTPSTQGGVYDSGYKTYGKNSFTIPDGVLHRGQKYYIHISLTDTTEIDNFVTKQVTMSGSSWTESVDNATGWTIELKVSVDDSAQTTPSYEPNLGLHIHDGTYFATIIFGQNNITAVSSESVKYPITDGDLSIARTFKICGKNTDLKVFMDNNLIIDTEGSFSHPSQLKLLEYGDIDPKNTNSGAFKFFRYSTAGASGMDSSFADNAFYFHKVGQLQNGSIDYIKDDLISWMPYDETQSAKLIKYNENAEAIRLPTVRRNYSPITSIVVDNNRNKFIGTANGITAIYGEKHDPDYLFDTSIQTTIPAQHFDRITSLTDSQIAIAEGLRKTGWFSLDTTYRSVGRISTEVDEYDPYQISSLFRTHAIHYYSQRTHGHRWYDFVNNSKGWNVRFGFQSNNLESDSINSFDTYTVTAMPSSGDVISKYMFADNIVYRIISSTPSPYGYWEISNPPPTIDNSVIISNMSPLGISAGMAFDENTGTLLVVDNLLNKLHRFDLVSGTLLGSVSISSNITAVTFAKEFGLFGIDNSNHTLYKVNPETGGTELIGQFHDNTSNYNIISMAYDPSTDTMYGFSSATDRYYTISLSNAFVQQNISDGSWTFTISPAISNFDADGLLYYVGASDLYTFDFTTNTQVHYTTIFADFGGVFAPAPNYLVHQADRMRIGRFDGSSFDAYIALPINVPAHSVIETSYLNLTAFSSEQSSGNPHFTISVIDFSDGDIHSLNEEASSSYLEETIDWYPNAWSANETGSNTRLDISSLVQAVVDRDGYAQGRRIIFKISTNEDSADGSYRVFCSGSNNLNKPSISTTYRNSTRKDGFGVYVNDGDRQEIIFLYDDKIRLFHANVYVPINNTVPRLFSIVAKDDNIQIYHKLASSAVGSYQLLLDGTGLFSTPSTRSGNSHKPRVVLDSLGTYHAVWHDDGNKKSQIFYSKFDGSWSVPELVTVKTQFSLKNPDIDIDSKGRLWVVYEDTSFGYTEISCSVRDEIGWNKKIRVTNAASNKRNPKVKVDTGNNVHVVWEDDRNGNSQLFWCEWDDPKQAWLSSGHFGSDTPITDHVKQATNTQEDPYTDDPYQSDDGNVAAYHNPCLSLNDTKLFVVYEKHLINTNNSSIFIGFRDTDKKYWNVEGSAIIINDTIMGVGTSTIVSAIDIETDQNSLSPTVSTLSGNIVVFWQESANGVSQIFGRALNADLTYQTDIATVTNNDSDCTNPSCGFVRANCVVVYECNDNVLWSFYNTETQEYKGSGVNWLSTSQDDVRLLNNTSKLALHPSIPPYCPVGTVKVLYDFLLEKDPYNISASENPDFRLIGSVDVLHEVVEKFSITTPDNEETISLLDTKEFAFGDFSENIGVNAHWKDIEMYFGYDAKPHSISKFNSSTVTGWPDNRVNDLFVDVYGNIVAATFGGLVYHNTIHGKTTIIEGHTVDYDPTKHCSEQSDKCLLFNKIATAVKWGKNGIWYVGTTEGCFYTRNAGRTWSKLFESTLGDKVINAITVDKLGQAIIATSSAGVFIAHPDMSAPIEIKTPNLEVICVSPDDNDVIWCGTPTGLFRVENYHTIIEYNINNGMRSSHVNDIAIVNTNLRYLATSTGVEKMYGSQFVNFNTKTHSLVNNNISSIAYYPSTNSLWIASLFTLHEIVFRDPEHNIINNEVVKYTTTEISTREMYDKNIYYILDFDKIQTPEGTSILDSESSYVFLNKNKLSFGYTIDASTQSIIFDTNLLINDNVEVETSNRFILFHDFNQSEIEKSVRGEKRQSIIKMDKTSRNQTLLLSDLDKPSILLYSGQGSDLPFATILLDRDVPRGCLEKLDNLTPTKLRFKLIAFDETSGLDGYILSNYENFTSDGSVPQDYLPFSPIVEHEIENGLTDVINSLSFEDEVTIDNTTLASGTGAKLEKWTDVNNKEWLFCATSNPVIVYKLDPETSEWTAIQSIANNVSTYYVTNIRNVNNVLYLTVGTTDTGNSGLIYRSVDGNTFDLIGAVAATSAQGVAGSIDGDVYVGSNIGTIYLVRNNTLSVAFTNIGETIHSCDIFDNILLVSTGNKGRLYSIDLPSGSDLIRYSGSEENVENVHIKDPLLSSTPSGAEVFISANSSSTIYRSNLETFDFIKSYSTFNKGIAKIITVDQSIFNPDIEEPGTITIAAIGDTIFKFTKPSWQFVYKHSEVIKDIIQYRSNDIDGIWVVSDTTVKKWTSTPKTKTVFLRLRDKAGNISDAPVVSPSCPNDQTAVCCNYAYSLTIADLRDFVYEGKLIDVSHDGDVQFSFNSPNKQLIYSGDRIDEEVGIYTSEIFNGSNDLVSWKSIQWETSEPNGTSVSIQIRSAATESEVADEDWTTLESTIKNVRIDFITDQYIQFRVLLKSRTRNTSPSLTSVTLRNITAQSSHFFTTNFMLPSKPIKGLLTTNTFIPVTADIIFGINTNNSVDFADYQIIEPNRLFTVENNQLGSNLRIGARLLSPGIFNPSTSDPYVENTYICTIDFDFSNFGPDTLLYHFRVRFYNDPNRTQLIHEFYSGNDQTGWSTGSQQNSFPSTGLSIGSMGSSNIQFVPESILESNQVWYLKIEAWNGSEFETVSSDTTFICSNCHITHELGLIAEYYNTGLATELVELPNFASLIPTFTLLDDNIAFGVSSGAWITSQDYNTNLTGRMAARWRGKIQIPVSGGYTFRLTSTDGSQLLIDSEIVIDNNQTGNNEQESELLDLAAGFHSIEILFFRSSDTGGITLEWTLPTDNTRTTVPASKLFHQVASEYCDNTSVPKLFNIGILFELENGSSVKINE